MAITIAGDVAIPRQLLTEEQIAAISDRFVVIEQTRQRDWRTGSLRDTARTIELVRPRGQLLTLPRGCASLLASMLPGAVIEDATTTHAETFTPCVAFRPHQLALADALRKRGTMLATAATGSGKTGAACAAMASLGQRTLVLVPTVELARQWARETERFLGVAATICTGGEWSSGAIVVATPETAMRFTGQLADFGLCVVDEVHGFATERRVFDLLAHIPARYRLGMTATLPTDHRARMLAAAFGVVGFRFSVADSLDSGVIVAPVLRQVRSPFTFDYGSADDWQDLLDAIAVHAARNAMIADLVAKECRGLCTLVLSARLAHLEALRVELEARGLRVAVVSGAVPSRERKAALEAAKAGQLHALLGSTVADEGIDAPALGSVVLAWPSRSESRLLQRIGRVLRPSPGKASVPPVVFDVIDDVGPLRSQARHRAEVFARTFGASTRRAA